MDDVKSQVLDAFNGRSYLIVQAAQKELARLKIDIVGYRVQVQRVGKLYVVIFTDENTPPGARGSVGKPGLEVEIDPRDMSVVRSYFIR